MFLSHLNPHTCAKKSLTSSKDIVVGGATIHKIDSVLTLPSNASTTAGLAGLTGITDAISAAGLDGLFDAAPGITAFIPTNEAFEAIAGIAAQLSTEELQNVLLLHLGAEATLYSTDIPIGRSVVTSALGQNVTINNNGTISVDNSKVVLPNIILSNGVGHVIDGYVIRSEAISDWDVLFDIFQFHETDAVEGFLFRRR